jgi:hypothetical protein
MRHGLLVGGEALGVRQLAAALTKYERSKGDSKLPRSKAPAARISKLCSVERDIGNRVFYLMRAQGSDIFPLATGMDHEKSPISFYSDR